MPELPEVETMRRGILPIVGGQIVDMVLVPLPLKPISIVPSKSVVRRRLRGQTIADVGRLGKRILVQLANSDTLVIEPRMTGIVMLDEAPDPGHLRVEWPLEGAKVPAFRFWDRRGLGTMQLLKSHEMQNLSGRLGPDAIALQPDELRSRLKASRREIKVALLDQAAVAGIGNLYAAEILHVSRINPTKRCHRLTRKEWCRLEEAILAVLEEAVKYEGSTLSDGTYRNALNQSGQYQNHHRVYAREGEPCPTCKTLVRRIVQAQRSTFWCPACQQR